MRKIRLSQGKVALVDNGDYEFLLNFGLWTARWKRATDLWYAVRREGRYLYMHSVIKEMIEDHGIPAGMVIDHLDGDGLNNQRANLQIVTVAENARRWHNRKLGFVNCRPPRLGHRRIVVAVRSHA
ncbi:MAG: endonuclease [Verrucomicrobiota bacterium]|jgi:hypothetical protein